MRDRAHGIRRAARRRWGQNFLVNRGAVERIVAAFAPAPADRVLEIGPGDGVLTRAIAGRVARLVAVEIDPALAADLETRLAPAAAPGRLAVVRGDILEIDLAATLAELAGDAPGGARVLGNLPYNIAIAILLRLFECRSHLRDLLVMVQREVADRIVSPPGRKSYGSFSVLCQLRARVDTILRLGPGSFRPAPKVDSAVIRFVLLPPEDDDVALPEVLRASFHQRRKTLLNNLAAWRPAGPAGPPIGAGEATAWLRRAGFDPALRAEALAPRRFLELARARPDALRGPAPVRSR